MINHHLSADQRAVLFDKVTEPAFSGALLYSHDEVDYRCANCQARLFDSSAKYDSSCGWPTFDRAIDDTVDYQPDSSYGMERTEVICNNCQVHLGHVFPDGPAETTGQRYCINSLAMNFEPTEK